MESAAALLRDAKDYKQLEKLGQYACRVQPFFDWEKLTLEALLAQGRYAEAKKLYSTADRLYRSELGIPIEKAVTEQYYALTPCALSASVSPKAFWSSLSDESEKEGGFLCAFPVFEGLCQREKRNTGAGQPLSFLLSVSLQQSRQEDPVPNTQRGQGGLLLDAILRAVRPQDAVTQLCGGQFLILLCDTDAGQCRAAVKQITRLFRESGGSCPLEHELLPLSTKDSGETLLS